MLWQKAIGAKGAGAAPWEPSDLSTLVAWYDATDTSTITASGSSLTQLTAKEGYGPTLTPYSNSPTVSVGNYIDFTLSPATPMVGVGSFGLADNPDMTIVFAARTPSSFSGNNGAGLRWISFGNDIASLSIGVGTAGWSWRHNGGFEAYNVPSLSTDYIVAFTHPAGGLYGSSGKCYENGVEKTATGGTSNSLTLNNSLNNFGLGGDNDGLNPGLYRFYEVVCAATVSDLDRQKIEGYLAHKHGFASLLPSGHPYKSSAP